MFLNQNNSDFNREGALTKDDLIKSPRVLLYKSDSLISSMSYAGRADKIVRSTCIPPSFTAVLKSINGYVSLGTTKTSQGLQYRNAHIYSSKATSLDGIERICYVYSVDSNAVGVSESSGNRGSSYSSLYRILNSKMISNSFDYNVLDGSFNVSLSRISEFVEIVNELIKEHEELNYELVKDEKKIDIIKIGKGSAQQNHYFNIAYWEVVKSYITRADKSDLSTMKGVEGIISDLDNFMQRIEDLDNVEDLKRVIDKLERLIMLSNGRKLIIESKQM